MPSLSPDYTWAADIKRKDKGAQVKLVQEWLSLHGYGTAIDKSFGAATEAAVAAFQGKVKLPATGIVDKATFDALVAPIVAALKPIASGRKSRAQLAIIYAQQHLKQRPREVGGPNSGPWVRMYTKGKEGAAYPWCAAFVSSILAQTAETLGEKAVVPFTLGCDALAASAKKIGRFVAGSDITSGKVPLENLGSAAIFLVRKKPGDWTHTGFATAFAVEHFQTIEGNTNDSGSREGYEVCLRTRAYDKKDFILID